MSSNNLARVEMICGNGTVYVAYRDKVTILRGYSYKIQRGGNKGNGKQYDVENEVSVALGCGVSRGKALELLGDVMKKIEHDMDFD